MTVTTWLWNRKDSNVFRPTPLTGLFRISQHTAVGYRVPGVGYRVPGVGYRVPPERGLDLSLRRRVSLGSGAFGRGVG
jgi:hypothetical protein